MDSNDSSANTTKTFGDAAAPAAATSDDEHLTVSSSSEDKDKKSAEKRRQDLFRRQEMRKESRSRPSAAGSSQRTPGARSTSATSSRKVITDSVKKKSGESTPPTRKSPRGSPSAPQASSSRDEAQGAPRGSPPRDLLYGQSHGVDANTVKELQAKLAEMTQEDEGATWRIIQLERERDNALALVRHVHERHLSEIHQQEARQQLRERHLQVSEQEIRVQQEQAQELRNEATQAVLQIGQQSQGEMFDMAKEYQKITQMMHHKAAENSALRSDLRFAEQLMMEAKEAMERSEAQEAFAVNEIQHSKHALFLEEQRAQATNQEFQRLRDIASEEITAERQRYDQLEVSQRPVLPSLHEEIVSLRTEISAQNSELRATKAELHVASARSSEWEHAGNSVGFPSTHVSHTPVTVISPAGSNSRNESNHGTPDKVIESSIPPAPQGPPVRYGPDPPVTYGPGGPTINNSGMSSFRDFADGLFRTKTKTTINWGAPMYTLEQAFPPPLFKGESKPVPYQQDVRNADSSRVDPPPGLSSSVNQASSSTSLAAPEPRASSPQCIGVLDEIRQKLLRDANGTPATTQAANIPTGSGDNSDEPAKGGQPEGGGDNARSAMGEPNDADKSDEIRQLIAELTRARKSEERMRKERNDWKGWAETFESDLEESRKGKEEPPNDGSRDDTSKGTGGPSYDSSGGGGNDGGGGDGGDPGGGDDAANSTSRKPGDNDPNGGDPPGDETNIEGAANDKPRISRREADKVTVPPFPKVLNLDAWKAATTTNVLAACADPHQEDWVRWLQEAYKPFPDIEKLE